MTHQPLTKDNALYIDEECDLVYHGVDMLDCTIAWYDDHVKSAVEGLRQELATHIGLSPASELIAAWFPKSHSLPVGLADVSGTMATSLLSGVDAVLTPLKDGSLSQPEEDSRRKRENRAAETPDNSYLDAKESIGCIIGTLKMSDNKWTLQHAFRVKTYLDSLSQPSVASSRNAEQTSKEDSVEGTGQRGVLAGELSDGKDDVKNTLGNGPFANCIIQGCTYRNYVCVSCGSEDPNKKYKSGGSE